MERNINTDNKSFVSDIPTLPLENNLIYNHKKMQATQFDPRDIPATPLGKMHNSLEVFKEKIINFKKIPDKSRNKEAHLLMIAGAETETTGCMILTGELTKSVVGLNTSYNLHIRASDT
jgi:hypothetical protein